MIEEKLDQILRDLELIKKQLKIVPNRETTITDFESSVTYYQEFAKDELGLEQPTIDNHKSAITTFLNHSKGIINKDTVKAYLDSNESDAWKTNQLKALRRYFRDFLGLGNWINEFHFSKSIAKIKNIPNDQKIAEFINLLPYKTQLVFLVMYNSGLRINEVLSLKLSNIDFESGLINASELHRKKTKSSWISFVTNQTAKLLDNYAWSSDFESDSDDPHLFPMSARSSKKPSKRHQRKSEFRSRHIFLEPYSQKNAHKQESKKNTLMRFVEERPKAFLQNTILTIRLKHSESNTTKLNHF